MTCGSRLSTVCLVLWASLWLPATAGQVIEGADRPEEDTENRDFAVNPRQCGVHTAVADRCCECGRFCGSPGTDDRLGLLLRLPLLPGLGRGDHPRHRGIGHPLQRESWLYRPFSAGWFMGAVQGSPLIDDWLGQTQGFFGGYRLGWDQSHYWGGEMRFGFGTARLYDSQRAIQAQNDADDAEGVPPDSPWRRRFDQRRDSDLFMWDLDVLYYPWGDSQWRPYLMAGLGTTRIHFMDRLSERHDHILVTVPLAAGVKYRCNDWLALRMEFADHIAFGGGAGMETMHNLTLTGGVEVRFGGSRRAYWPYNPGRHYW